MAIGGEQRAMTDEEASAWNDIDLRSPRRAAYCGTEHAFQKALMTEVRMNSGRIPELSLMFAIPNGGQRNKAAAGKLKAEGVKAGVPDLCLPVRAHGAPGLWIELKVQNGTVGYEQRHWLLALHFQGYRCAVVNDRETFWWLITDYLGAFEGR